MKNVLVLGAGLVSAPLVRHLLERADLRLVVGALNVERARELVGDHPQGYAMALDVADAPALDGVLRAADLVISLLPPAQHPVVARRALAHRVPVITTSYVSPEMRALDAEARSAGVLLLNEVGLDPGIDHMSAMRIVARVQRAGGRITHFSSCCGGLPAPEANDNPWGYKFSWSPRGVLLAGRSPARYLRAGEVVEIPGPELFAHHWPIALDGLGRLEVYPNRDSVAYADTYRLSGIANLFRGTIRYPGWCASLQALARLGLLDVEPLELEQGTTWSELSARHAPGSGPARERIAARIDTDMGARESGAILERLRWAGLLEDEPIRERGESALDLLCARLEPRMAYRPHERDMVVLWHHFVVEQEGGPARRIEARLVAFGEERGDSAMARTVSLPAAVAARLVLEGRLERTGVAIPVEPDLYEPILAGLEELGVRVVETDA